MSFSFKTLAISVVGVALAFIPVAESAAQDRDNRNNEEGSTFMSPRTYARITNATEAMNEGQYQEAFEALRDLAADVEDSPYELAVTLQTTAYVFINQEKYEQAADYLKRALDLNALPPEPEQGVIYSLAQIYGVLGQYEKTIQMMTGWLKTAENPPADAYITLANAYYVMERYKEAYPVVKKALALMKEPQEQWLKLALGVQYELEKYREAANTLEILVANWPDENQYWRQLSGIYIQLGEDQKALATMALAYEKGALKDEDEFLNLARLYLLNDVPYPGAVILEDALAAEKVERTEEHYELLAQAWVEAREYEKGIAAMKKAAEYAEDGALFIRAAQLEMSLANWEGAAAAARKALEKGGLDSEETGNAWLLLGTAAAEEDDFETAVEAFEKARGYPETRENATQWLAFVQTEREVSTLN
ncbi:MAG TPA: tetratricopeptide repeat protein [Gammaproteobacteria bacterium]